MKQLFFFIFTLSISINLLIAADINLRNGDLFVSNSGEKEEALTNSGGKINGYFLSPSKKYVACTKKIGVIPGIDPSSGKLDPNNTSDAYSIVILELQSKKVIKELAPSSSGLSFYIQSWLFQNRLWIIQSDYKNQRGQDLVYDVDERKLKDLDFEEETSAPLPLTDEISGSFIARALIIPRYSEFKGVSSGAGHGPGFDIGNDFIAGSFIYKKGEKYKRGVDVTSGVTIAGFAVGENVNMIGLAVFAPGYEPKFISDLFGPRVPSAFQLKQISSKEWTQELDSLKSIVNADVVPDAKSLILGCNCEIHNCMTPAEKEIIRGFINENSK
jgi:hypothetical protein